MSSRHLLVHYHLRPGGVTTVLREQARALAAAGRDVWIATGEAPSAESGEFPARVVVIPDLGYRDAALAPHALARAHDQLSALAGPRGVLHFHNPTLAKNPSLPALAARLAASGHALLLQIHDFGEDGRWPAGNKPGDHDRFYPTGPRLRWLVLHPDDRRVLIKAGIPAPETAILPNPVAPPSWGTLPPGADGRTRVLYPSRGIRRKNTGEFLLLAALAPPAWEFRLSLPPLGRAQENHFQRWRKWAGALGSNTLLGMGAGGFRPDLVLSTSTREGFGYSFAEPWRVGVPATGRHPGRWPVDGDGAALPRPPGLYQSIRVPAAWLRPGVWQHAIRDCIPDPDRQSRVARKFSTASVDFADLPESEQRQVLRRVARAPVEGGALRFDLIEGHAVEPAAWFAMVAGIPPAFIAAMGERVRDAFSPDRMAGALDALANEARTAEGGLRGWADASMVERHFENADTFRFLHQPPP